jgi:hypothetical protein
MRNLLLLALIFFCSIKVNGQNNAVITGKWKIVYIDMGIQHDYKSKKTTIPKEMEAVFKSKKEEDLMAKAFIVEMIKGFENYCYVFDSNGQYEEIQNGKQKSKGAYKIDDTKKSILLNSKNKLGIEDKQELNYEIKKDVLSIKIPSDGGDLSFVLEKV